MQDFFLKKWQKPIFSNNQHYMMIINLLSLLNLLILCGGFPAQAICPLWGVKLARFCSQVT